MAISDEVIGNASICEMLNTDVVLVDIFLSVSLGSGRRDRPSALACSSVLLYSISTGMLQVEQPSVADGQLLVTECLSWDPELQEAVYDP